jgi:hypothetical protein
MKRSKGLGFLYQPKYHDRTGEIQTSPTWWISVSHRGHRIRMSSGSQKHADAVKVLKSKLAEMGSGRPVIPNVERTSFEDLAKMLVDDYRANGRRSIRLLPGKLGHLRNFFGMDRALDITSDRVTAYIAHRMDAGAANATCNRELAALKRAFRLAHKAGRVGIPPEIDLLHESNARKGFFDEDQFRSVLARLPEELQPVVHTAFVTGWRCRAKSIISTSMAAGYGWIRTRVKTGRAETFRSRPNCARCYASNSSEREPSSGRPDRSCRGCSIVRASLYEASVDHG